MAAKATDTAAHALAAEMREIEHGIEHATDTAAHAMAAEMHEIKHEGATMVRWMERKMQLREEDRVRVRNFHFLAYDHWVNMNMQTSSDIRQQLYLVLERPFEHRTGVHARAFTVAASAFLGGSVLLTLLFLLLLMLGTNASPPSSTIMKSILALCCAFFTLELALRAFAMAAPLSTVRARRDRMLMIVRNTFDLVAIVAGWLLLLRYASDEPRSRREVLELLASLRCVRLFPALERYFKPAELMWRTIVHSAPTLFVSFLALALGAYVFAVLVYYAEFADFSANGWDFEAEAPFPDLATAFWFMIVTFSTVGYGDVSPVTPAGKSITAVAILCGVTFTAMPITIVGESFAKVWEDRRRMDVVVALQKSMLEQGMKAQDLIYLFQKDDTDGDGELSFLEFRSALSGLGLKLPLPHVRSVFKMFDEDGSGTVNYQEFCHVIFPKLDVEALSSSTDFLENSVNMVKSMAAMQAEANDMSSYAEVEAKVVRALAPLTTHSQEATREHAKKATIRSSMVCEDPKQLLTAGSSELSVPREFAAGLEHMEQRLEVMLEKRMSKEFAVGLEHMEQRFQAMLEKRMSELLTVVQDALANAAVPAIP